MTLTKTDLISSLQALPLEYGGMEGYDNTPLKLFFRVSSEGYLVGKGEYKIGKPGKYTWYFYCW